ncbi:hypothetical protein LDENG_00119250 [Lucifuga dentata]|nr:hypothetical protein LDENG_00119250 [Lucifuga dentata]
MWPCVVKQPSHPATGTALLLPTMPSMEAVNLVSQPDPAPPLHKQPTPGGEWTCCSPT